MTTKSATLPFPARAVLPAMATLLDSKDPQAQLRSARFLGYFTLFSDANGNMMGTGSTGPFATEQTRQFTPSKSSQMTPAQHAEFWKVWWSQNYVKLGFAAP